MLIGAMLAAAVAGVFFSARYYIRCADAVTAFVKQTQPELLAVYRSQSPDDNGYMGVYVRRPIGQLTDLIFGDAQPPLANDPVFCDLRSKARWAGSIFLIYALLLAIACVQLP
ncbi:MAG TPA: hypothetical protein VHL34_02605 [Rhizomicrobium sp.]|nr:hypothetical protein [Rhizomicrobium sp.]